MKPKLTWWMKLVLKVALMLLPLKWRELLDQLIKAYDSIPDDRLEPCHDNVCDVITINGGSVPKREGIGSGPSLSKE